MNDDFTTDLAEAVQKFRAAFVDHGLQPPEAIVLGSKTDMAMVRGKFGAAVAAGARPFDPPCTIFGVKLLPPTDGQRTAFTQPGSKSLARSRP